ncbi:MAG: RluA family pseudouridine synthase [Lentimonas sp.]
MSKTAQIDELPFGRGVTVITSNEDGLVALAKPVGVLSHPNTDRDIKRSLLRATYDYDEEVFIWKDEAGNEKRAWLVNRLDSSTSGVILLALNPEISAIIKQCFATHKVHKTYYALVKRTPPKPTGVWNDVLKKDQRNGARVIKRMQNIPAKARFQVVRTPVGGFPICLIKLMPITGRTHQLRVQCGKHGHPIVGDRTYGSFSFNREVAHETKQKRMMLHSCETIVNYAFKGKIRIFEASSELPESFQEVLGYRPGLSHGRLEPQAKIKTDPNKIARPVLNRTSRPGPDKRLKSKALAQRRFKR